MHEPGVGLRGESWRRGVESGHERNAGSMQTNTKKRWKEEERRAGGREALPLGVRWAFAVQQLLVVTAIRLTVFAILQPLMIMVIHLSVCDILELL